MSNDNSNDSSSSGSKATGSNNQQSLDLNEKFPLEGDIGLGGELSSIMSIL